MNKNIFIASFIPALSCCTRVFAEPTFAEVPTGPAFWGSGDKKLFDQDKRTKILFELLFCQKETVLVIDYLKTDRLFAKELINSKNSCFVRPPKEIKPTKTNSFRKSNRRR